MTDIIKEITSTCARKDCALAFNDYGISNMAGHTSGVICQACKREWNVFKPARIGPMIYDCDGKRLDQDAPVIITARTPR